MSTCQRGYPVPACQFLSTLEATFHISHDPHETEGHGFITFKVDRKFYKMGFKEIASVMGLRDRRRHKFKKFEDELNKFWTEIGAGEYDISAIKFADILHPALRYVHKLLASTLYARKEAGRIVQDELHFLIFGISSVTTKYRQGRYEHQPGTVRIFIERLIYYKKWAWTNHDKKPKLFILGFITPLLEAMNIPLVGDEIEFAVMDEVHLDQTGFLDGILDGKYIYRYKKGSRKESCSVLLPCLP
ncbi:hypothetical protein F2Q70_00002384 [Brassica cretica]|uniref:Arabidopsis retrotransposon Orf1 C-terminal domain-containing protein n=1 Tax=Brassica cretica TaxID=69181 RepID=A0A8S9J174_BRACR|nr:hypothetical protein F2Q70_00002384 [Brassica cretica]